MHPFHVISTKLLRRGRLFSQKLFKICPLTVTFKNLHKLKQDYYGDWETWRFSWFFALLPKHRLQSKKSLCSRIQLLIT